MPNSISIWILPVVSREQYVKTLYRVDNIPDMNCKILLYHIYVVMTGTLIILKYLSNAIEFVAR